MLPTEAKKMIGSFAAICVRNNRNIRTTAVGAVKTIGRKNDRHKNAMCVPIRTPKLNLSPNSGGTGQPAAQNSYSMFQAFKQYSNEK